MRCALPGHVRDAHRDAARVDGLGELERADHPRDEVRRHRDRRREADAHAAVGERLAADLGTVRDREQPVGDDERDGEDRLELGLVEARERAGGRAAPRTAWPRAPARCPSSST